MPRITKLMLATELAAVRADLEASEEVVEKQIRENTDLETKLRGQSHSITDLRDNNTKLQSRCDKGADQIRYDDKQIKEFQVLTNGLRRECANYQSKIIDAETAMELGLRLFYPDALGFPDDAKDPKARLLLRVFDILGKDQQI